MPKVASHSSRSRVHAIAPRPAQRDSAPAAMDLDPTPPDDSLPLGQRIRFHVPKKRPSGSPGKNNYNFRQTLRLSVPEYTYVLNGMRQLCVLFGLDMTRTLKFQNQMLLNNIYNKALEVFPGFGYFPDPIWVMRDFVYVVLKGSKEKTSRIEKAAAKASAKPPISPNTEAARWEARRESARKAAQRRAAAQKAAKAKALAATAVEDTSVEDLTNELNNASLTVDEGEMDEDEPNPAPVLAPIAQAAPAPVLPPVARPHASPPAEVAPAATRQAATRETTPDPGPFHVAAPIRVAAHTPTGQATTTGAPAPSTTVPDAAPNRRIRPKMRVPTEPAADPTSSAAQAPAFALPHNPPAVSQVSETVRSRVSAMVLNLGPPNVQSVLDDEAENVDDDVDTPTNHVGVISSNNGGKGKGKKGKRGPAKGGKGGARRGKKANSTVDNLGLSSEDESAPVLAAAPTTTIVAPAKSKATSVSVVATSAVSDRAVSAPAVSASASAPTSAAAKAKAAAAAAAAAPAAAEAEAAEAAAAAAAEAEAAAAAEAEATAEAGAAAAEVVMLVRNKGKGKKAKAAPAVGTRKNPSRQKSGVV
ncbi:hypothetical protein FS749_003266 [Ceratobasidium sp. UAMH 11750]|nr:hypothetical protein FS749_003266 [Ceratobasidium sp. UAMH 11750]